MNYYYIYIMNYVMITVKIIKLMDTQIITALIAFAGAIGSAFIMAKRTAKSSLSNTKDKTVDIQGNSNTISTIENSTINVKGDFHLNHQTSKNEEIETNNDSQLAPPPNEIYEKIEKIPPLQRKMIAQQYIGMKVCWPLFFKSASHEENNMAQVFASPLSSSLYIVVFQVSLNDYPKLRILDAYTKIKIYGEIIKIDSLSIEIKIHRLEF